MKTGNLIRNMKKTVDRLNGIIASRNLYMVTEQGNRRMIDAHVKDSNVCVRDLYTEQSITVQGKKFMDGYNAEVVI